MSVLSISVVELVGHTMITVIMLQETPYQCMLHTNTKKCTLFINEKNEFVDFLNLVCTE